MDGALRIQDQRPTLAARVDGLTAAGGRYLGEREFTRINNELLARRRLDDRLAPNPAPGQIKGDCQGIGRYGHRRPQGGSAGFWQADQEPKKQHEGSGRGKQLQPPLRPQAAWLPKVLSALQVMPAISH